ncbi:HNH endonuclease [Hyphococcus formosus]|uniref:HNH endonuclease n=1 Tax=Hyphococcus formosus TaxID=3143534 RepID=UPI00398A7EAE
MPARNVRGYVLERITDHFGKPNAAFDQSERALREQEKHAEFADSLVAVHKLHFSSRPLQEIIGADEFEELQDIWSENHQRNRWSVAFPIVESYEIIGAPKARNVFSPSVFKRHFQYSTAVLKPLDDEARKELADLEIAPVPARNLWIVLEDVMQMANGSDIDPTIADLMDDDMAFAMEGEDEEKRSRARKRAAWLAHRFINKRRTENALHCDDCGFDPQTLKDIPQNRRRSCLDVHHRAPLAEGVRLTTIDDFALLCPTCHRLEHVRLSLSLAKPIR